MRFLAVLCAKLHSQYIKPKVSETYLFVHYQGTLFRKDFITMVIITTTCIRDKILMNNKCYIFCDVKEGSLVNVYRCFKGTSCHHHQI